jgi:penicillin-binding protein 1B
MNPPHRITRDIYRTCGRFLLSHTWAGWLLIAAAIVGSATTGVATFYYMKYARMIDQTLRTGAFANTSTLYAAPEKMMLGEEVRMQEIVSRLQRSGYSASSGSGVGWYLQRPDSLEINPGPEAYSQEGAVFKIQGGRLAQIIALPDHTSRAQYVLEPEPITNLFDQNRDKRRVVRFNEMPTAMVNAILSAEDKRFFHHDGFDPLAILRAIWVDLKDRKRSQGASTLTQQLARTLWLGHERGWRRKIPETLITVHLERTLSKRQILEDYANAIYLGNEGSFGIHGFAKASQVYLGKDLSQVTPSEAAFMAGLIQAPQSRNPFRYPGRAKARRDLVLKAMHANGFLTGKEYESAVASPLQVRHEETESIDAPYFADLVTQTLEHHFRDYDFENHPFRVYTTLDMNLQHDAEAAVRAGIRETDQQWKRRSKTYGTAELPLAQVALIALDAQTGEVKALVGGRNYSVSQLNRALAKRQPGSSFKPFVYTAALSAALTQGGPVLTPATTIDDEPATFYFNGKTYEPSSHESEYAGRVTLRFALAHSLNVPAVKLAEMAGYDKVARVARAAGLNVDIRPTPSIALGAYEVTPLEMAGAYTVFVNYGNLVEPSFIRSVRGQQSAPVFESGPQRKFAIDPRVAYLVENMMEEVLVSGTGAGVRARGFYLPAAGKTGTSRDGWFAGFTSRLICVVWVGFDDNRDFKLSGAQSALPIWTEFMKRAHQHRDYQNIHGFQAPSGIVTAEIDAETGELATARCPKVRSEVFIEGTQPTAVCHMHSERASYVPVTLP